MSETPADGAARVKFIDRPWVRWFIGAVLLGSYVRLIKLTSRVIYDPPDCFERVDRDLPFISASWHGHSFLALAYAPRPNYASVLISNHPDGRMAAALAQSLGIQSIDGSGASERQQHGTGGAMAFRTMLKALKAGTNLSITADITPVPGRHVSPGIIALARRTGRPVWAFATATSRRKIVERSWDKMQINYPFSTVAFVVDGPLLMTDETVSDEAYAAELKALLDRALERAFAIADGKR